MSDLPTREDWPVPGPAPGAAGPPVAPTPAGGDTRVWPAVRPPPRAGMGGCARALIVGVVAAVVLGLGACSAVLLVVDRAADEAGRARARERLDVAAPGCRLDGAGLMAGEAKVTNRSSKRSNYVIRMTFEGTDGSQLATAGALVTSLEPGQSTTATAHTYQAPPHGGTFSCRVVTVDRFSDQS